MAKNLRWKLLVIVGVVALAVWAFYPPEQKVRLGLDLKGGVHLVMRVQTDDALKLETEMTAERLREYLLKGGFIIFDDFEGEDAIPIMTIHKSKGLEYHTVVFMGLEDAAFRNFTTQSEEESRAFFVAFSRAKDRVLFTFCQRRSRSLGRPATPQTLEDIRSLYELLQDARVGMIDHRKARTDDGPR